LQVGQDRPIGALLSRLTQERWCRYLRHGYKWILARTAT
jgi:hypothetical protein